MTNEQQTSALRVFDLARLLDDEQLAPRRLVVRFGSCCIAIASNDRLLAEELARYYRPYLTESSQVTFSITAIESPPPHLPIPLNIKPPDPGKTKVKEEYADLIDGRVVRKRLTGLCLLFGNSVNLVAGPVRANANQVINFVNNRYIQYLLDRESLLLHAAAVRINGTGIAICGFSGMGKSTLSLKLMSLGGTFISNDRLLVARTSGRLQMFGVAKLPRINPGTILHNPDLHSMLTPEQFARYEALSPAELWDLEEKYDAFVEQIWGEGRLDLTSSFDLLVILNWRRAEHPLTISPVQLDQREDLIPAFAKEPGLFYLPTHGRPSSRASDDQYRELLGTCPIVECTGAADFDAAAERLVELSRHQTS